jgi:hypothetical protein
MGELWMSDENAVKTIPYTTNPSSLVFSDSLRRVVENVSATTQSTSDAAKAFNEQLTNYVRAQG